jgi:hypothetical protein
VRFVCLNVDVEIACMRPKGLQPESRCQAERESGHDSVRFRLAPVVPRAYHERRSDAVSTREDGHALFAIAENREERGLERMQDGASTGFEGAGLWREFSRRRGRLREQRIGIAPDVIGVRSECEKRECDDDRDEQ